MYNTLFARSSSFRKHYITLIRCAIVYITLIRCAIVYAAASGAVANLRTGLFNMYIV